MRKRCIGNFCIAHVEPGQKYCPKCKAKADQKYHLYSSLYDTGRRTHEAQFRDFYLSPEWRALRDEILSDPKGVICNRCKRSFSNHCHHIIPLKEDWSLRLDRRNIEPLCPSCHSKHELRERYKNNYKPSQN